MKHVTSDNTTPNENKSLESDHWFRERLVGVSEVIDYLSISKRTLYRLISKGEFPKPIRVGGSVRWRPDQIMSYLDRASNKARQPPKTRQS